MIQDDYDYYENMFRLRGDKLKYAYIDYEYKAYEVNMRYDANYEYSEEDNVTRNELTQVSLYPVIIEENLFKEILDKADEKRQMIKEYYEKHPDKNIYVLKISYLTNKNKDLTSFFGTFT